jgi:pSer/pThr/pTyr-binding forkhead associated (FHA) protein
MKLVFPNGEHGQVLLNHGVNRIGTSADNAIVLPVPGMLPVHCEIHITQNGANLQVPQGAGPVTVNGNPIADLMALRSGDILMIGNVQAKFLLVEVAKSAPVAAGAVAAGPDDDSGATRVRMAVPKFLLRGVSGSVFSKVFPIIGPVVIGRAAECDIAVTADEISRRHALVKPTPDGLSVEDLGSSNGTFINNKRVQHGFLNPGDELRLDAVRFIMVAPGMEMNTASPQQSKSSSAKASGGSGGSAGKYVAGFLILAAIVAIAYIVVNR